MSYSFVLNKVASHAMAHGRDPDTICLIAVSKYQSMETVLELYREGALHFGESRVQEALGKISSSPQEIEWHFIGSLQKNKVNRVVGKFALIHSIDHFEIAKALSLASEKAGVETAVLLQVNTSGEVTKRGLDREQWTEEFLKLLHLKNIRVEGLMTMAPLTEDRDVVRSCFIKLRKFKEFLENRFSVQMRHLSMGMSNDYKVAIEEGATLLRIGSSIFSPRE